MTEPAPLYAIDSNVILRYVAKDNPHLLKQARAILWPLDTGEVRVLCDPVILSEVVFVLGKIYDFSPAQISAGLLPLVRLPGFVMPDKKRYIHALELYATAVPHFGDACACAAALEETEGRLYSFDKKLSRVDGVTRLEQPRKS